ncbi:MAG: hypothetical protein AAF660_13265 [Pseudomonadota bacterium]
MKNARTIALGALAILAAPAGLVAMENIDMDGLQSWVGNHLDTTWSGESELWVDPTSDAETSAATLNVGSDKIGYTWVYKGTDQSGELRWSEETLQWKDSWHQPEGVALTLVTGHGSLFAAEYSYPVGTGPDWHWRIKLAERPDGSLVLQMTNIASWGEEAQAVRTVVRRSE